MRILAALKVTYDLKICMKSTYLGRREKYRKKEEGERQKNFFRVNTSFSTEKFWMFFFFYKDPSKGVRTFRY